MQRATLNLLKLVLATAGSDFTKLLKVNIYLTNMADFAAMNAVCMRFSGSIGRVLDVDRK